MVEAQWRDARRFRPSPQTGSGLPKCASKAASIWRKHRRCEDAVAVEALADLGRFGRLGGQPGAQRLFGLGLLRQLPRQARARLRQVALPAREIEVPEQRVQRQRRRHPRLHQVLALVKSLFAAIQLPARRGDQLIRLGLGEIRLLGQAAQQHAILRIRQRVFGLLHFRFGAAGRYQPRARSSDARIFVDLRILGRLRQTGLPRHETKQKALAHNSIVPQF